ncbi:hypothetical protein Tco_0648905 [Tanacetum coccineum]
MPYDSSIPRGHTSRSDEGRMQQNELIDLVTKLTDRVVRLEKDLKETKKVYSTAFINLIIKVKKLEKIVKSNKARRRAKFIVLDDEEDLEDSSKQGRKIADIDQDFDISLFPLVTTVGVSTAGAELSTVIPKVSTATENLVYIRRSAENRKDKGKAIIKENESVKKKTKNNYNKKDLDMKKLLDSRQEQEKYDLEKALDLQKYHALQNRSFSIAEVRKNMCMYLKNQRGYKQSHFKRMSYEDVRLIFERVWDQNHAFVPKNSKIEKEVMKRPGFDLQQKSIKKSDKIEASCFVQKQPAKEEKEKKNDDSQQQAGSSKKKSREDSDEDNAKKQKQEDEAKKEELRACMDVIPRDDIAIDVESLATKYQYLIGRHIS